MGETLTPGQMSLANRSHMELLQRLLPLMRRGCAYGAVTVSEIPAMNRAVSPVSAGTP